MSTHAVVQAVAASLGHGFSKPLQPAITLLAGLGVEGDAHMGVTVKHRSRVRADPTQPNLRQVHLIHGELLDELTGAGFRVGPGVMGETSPRAASTCWACRAARAAHRARGDRRDHGPAQSLLAAGRLSTGPDRRRAGAQPRRQPDPQGWRHGRGAGGRQGGRGDRILVELPAPPYRALERV